MDIFYLNTSPLYRAVLRMTIKGIGKIRKKNRKVRFLSWCVREDNLFYYLCGLKFYTYDTDIFEESLPNPGEVFRYIVAHQRLPIYFPIESLMEKDEFMFLYPYSNNKENLLNRGCEYYVKSFRNKEAMSLLNRCVAEERYSKVFHWLSIVAIRVGNLEFLGQLNKKLFEEALGTGKYNTIKFFLDRGYATRSYSPGNYTIEKADAKGLEWLIQNCVINNLYLVEGLIDRGNLDDLKTYYNGNFHHGHMKLAIKTGKLEIVKLVHSRSNFKSYRSSCLRDCLIYKSIYPERDYIIIFTFLANLCNFSEKTVTACLDSGIEKVIEISYEKDPVNTKKYFYRCIEKSDIVKQYPQLWNGMCSREAAKHGKIELLKWAYSNNLKISRKVLSIAAIEEKLDIVTWYVREII